jgi:hypothetical protein
VLRYGRCNLTRRKRQLPVNYKRQIPPMEKVINLVKRRQNRNGEEDATDRLLQGIRLMEGGNYYGFQHGSKRVESYIGGRNPMIPRSRKVTKGNHFNSGRCVA